VLLGQLDEVSDPARASIEQNRDTCKKQPAGKRACLDECKPILLNPFIKSHCSPTISNL
jgi:hypothetical protein